MEDSVCFADSNWYILINVIHLTITRLTRVVPDKGPLNGCVCVTIITKILQITDKDVNLKHGQC